MTMEQRRLAAIVSADVAGYSRLMGWDESGTLAALKAIRQEVVDPAIASHGGRIVKTTGDGLLLEFPSVVNAVRCALEVQAAMAARTAGIAENRRIAFRIGINLGDIIVDGDDIFGDGVNVAARLQEIAPPGGICISSRVHDDVRDRLATQFEEGGVQTLKNIARPIQVWRWQPGKAVVPKSAPAPMALTLPEKPSIAVLPFQNMSGDPEQEYFADGVVEDIITALSRFKSLFVIARNSSFTYKGRAVDVKQVGRELGVRYVLEGSVRKASGRVRITGQLIDCGTGAHLWADRFDGSLQDIFDLQDQVTTSVVGAIAPRLDQAEIERAKRGPTQNGGAYDCYLRAMTALYGLTGKATDDTLHWLDQALEIDPDYALAHALKAFCYSWMMNSWMADREQESTSTERHARRAVELAKDDAAVLAYAGYSLAGVLGDLEDGTNLIDRALELNPNLAIAWAASAWLRVFLGQPDKAIEHADRYMRLSPLDPNMQSLCNSKAAAHISAGRYSETVVWARRAMQAKADWTPPYRLAAAAEALAGRVEESRKYLRRLQELDPGLRISSLDAIYRAYRPEYVARVKEGLRKAGLPE